MARANSLTAIRAVNFSTIGSRIGPIAYIAFFFGVETWNVPTNGPSAAEHARSESEGIAGSCRCSKSKSPEPIHCLALELATGPKITRATDPLTGIDTGLPALTK